MVTINNGRLIWGVLLLFSCTNQSVEKQFAEFTKVPVIIPYQQLDQRKCSMFADTLSEMKPLRLINYIIAEGCTPCKVSALTFMEKQSRGKKNLDKVAFVYVVETTSKEKDFVYTQFRDARIEGSVYLDTCHAFRTANPHIPDNPLFHTFVLNKQDSVVLIGDPFKNDKMESLFLKVIEREKQRKVNENH